MSNISQAKHRNGFISNNNDVQVSDFNNVSATYGASSFGGKGVANHNSLTSMFNKPSDFNDYNLSIALLSGRGALESGPDVEQGTFQNNLTQGFVQAFAGNTDESEQRFIQATALNQRADFEEKTADGDSLEGNAFNPDFPSGSVNYFYNDKQSGTNRSKDGIVIGSLAPNAAFASQGFENPEQEVEYLSPLKGQGGFGNSVFTNKVSPVEGETVNTIINRYV